MDQEDRPQRLRHLGASFAVVGISPADASIISQADKLEEYRRKVADTNIDSRSLLSTDYFNTFNSVVMVLDVLPDAPELLEEIAEIIIERRLYLRYLCYARLEKGFTAELLKKLYHSGLRKLMFGLESGSDHTLKKIHKKT